MSSFLDRWRSHRRKSAFTELVRPHIDHLFRLAYRLTNDEQRAEDLLQDVLVKLYERDEDLAQVEQLKPWLARVLYRQYVDGWRRERNAPALLSELSADFDADHLPAEALPPELIADQGKLQEQLEAAIGLLNSDQRDVLLLHDVQGYKLEEISTIVQSPVGTLKSRLFRARAALRAQLEAENE